MVDNADKFNLLRKKYPEFIFEKYDIFEDELNIYIKYYFRITNLTSFKPEIRICKKQIEFKKLNHPLVQDLVFNLGLIELISYWKATCSPKVLIKCGSINDEQIAWFKKLYFNGLGELFYRNNIKTTFEDFLNIICDYERAISTKPKDNENDNYQGVLIPVSGGKDSTVTLELIKNNGQNYCFIVNPNEVARACVQLGGYQDEQIIEIYRSIDAELLKLNQAGFINGHTPFSAMIAFLSYFVAFLTNRKYITLSNESSANEANGLGLEVNHQYSKSFEFEQDFNHYINKYLNTSVQYFSFLRPLNELQIAMLFAKNQKYHQVFKSCNVGSKIEPWQWCCTCPKCLFVYIMLSPFLNEKQLINIFGTNLLANNDLIDIFKALLGYGEIKPFECVGTFEETNYAVTKTIIALENNKQSLPYLLQHYKDNYPLASLDIDLTKLYNEKNNLPKEFAERLKGVIAND